MVIIICFVNFNVCLVIGRFWSLFFIFKAFCVCVYGSQRTVLRSLFFPPTSTWAPGIYLRSGFYVKCRCLLSHPTVFISVSLAQLWSLEKSPFPRWLQIPVFCLTDFSFFSLLKVPSTVFVPQGISSGCLVLHFYTDNFLNWCLPFLPLFF